uniref:Uncharacterized protein n=1 Tax=Arundo donax TaxID=35708 RepID=A0A0A9GPW6_ARUDO
MPVVARANFTVVHQTTQHNLRITCQITLIGSQELLQIQVLIFNLVLYT